VSAISANAAAAIQMVGESEPLITPMTNAKNTIPSQPAQKMMLPVE
jgi:hypothetical protein